MKHLRRLFVLCVLAAALAAQPKRILYVTHSAGFRHDSLPVSAEVMRSVAAATGKLEVAATDDVSLLNAATLRGYDAVFFFTSGELPISDQQKRDLLEFVRSGKGFGGAHSATDTFYNWPEYGDMIGAYFNGHPWVQSVSIDFEDPAFPAFSGFDLGLTIQDEIYQFRNFSRDRARVLMSLDTRSVDLNAPGVNPNTDDFPITWIRNYGSGRVFYTALGHFNETWRDARFQQILSGALLWLTGQVEADATPRPRRKPQLAPNGIANAASLTPAGTVSIGSIITLFGENLAWEAQAAADLRTPPPILAGTSITVGGKPAPIFYVSPSQVNAYVPQGPSPLLCLGTAPCPPSLVLILTASGGRTAATLSLASATPGIFAVTASQSLATIWATGLGAVERRGDLDYTLAAPAVRIGDAPARVQFSGLAPGWLGLYQINVEIPAGTAFPARLELRLGDYLASTLVAAAD
jgi:uncharacterized protein (TIGR03437 family)